MRRVIGRPRRLWHYHQVLSEEGMIDTALKHLVWRHLVNVSLGERYWIVTRVFRAHELFL